MSGSERDPDMLLPRATSMARALLRPVVRCQKWPFNISGTTRDIKMKLSPDDSLPFVMLIYLGADPIASVVST